MKVKSTIFSLLFLVVAVSCSKNIDYTPEFINETSGKYLFNQNDIIEVFYEDKKMFLKWRGAEKIEHVVLSKNTFFVVDMYKKLQFVKHPKTKKRYLSIIPEDKDSIVSYDFLKVDEDYKTPSQYLKDREYDKALAGYLKIQKLDSTSAFINERSFNSLGYEFLRKQEYKDAIEVFKLNVALYPESGNVYDSLGEAYLRNGDSLQAYNNYKKALEYNAESRMAKKYLKTYSEKKN